jgi:hypothetical protein
MASPAQIDTLFVSTFSCGTASLPAACVGDTQIKAGATGAYVQATKLQHQAPGVIGGSVQIAGPTTTVATVTQTLGMAKGVGTLASLDGWIEVAAVGAATVTVDLQKSTGGGAYATVLSATMAISSATVIRTAVPTTISAASYVAGDIFRIVCTATAGGGTLPQGLTLRLVAREEPQ